MKMPLLTLVVLRKSVKFWDGGYHQNLLMFWYTFFSAKGSTPPIQRKIGPKNISLLNAESYLGIFANLQDFFEGFKKSHNGVFWSFCIEGVGQAMCGREGECSQYGRGLEGWQVTIIYINLFCKINLCINRAFLAMLHHYRPELVDIENMQEGNAVENCTMAFSIAEVNFFLNFRITTGCLL